MPETKPTQMRLPAETLRKILDLAAKWGGVRALPRTQVVIEAVDRQHEIEFKGERKGE